MGGWIGLDPAKNATHFCIEMGATNMKCNLSQLFFILYVTGKLCSPHLKLSLIEREIQVDQSVGNYSFQFFQRSNPTYNWTNPQITVKWLKSIQSFTLANTCDLCTLTILGSPHIENGQKNRQCPLWATPPHDLFIKQPYKCRFDY